MGSLALQLLTGFINGKHQQEIEGKEESEVRVFVPLGSFLSSHWDLAVSSDQRPQLSSGSPVLQSQLLFLGSYNCSLEGGVGILLPTANQTMSHHPSLVSFTLPIPL